MPTTGKALRRFKNIYRLSQNLDEPPLNKFKLTARQAEILYWVQEGKSSSDIGVILGLSHRTIEHHVESVCQRFGVRTRVQAMLKARDLGLIGLAPKADAPRSLES